MLFLSQGTPLLMAGDEFGRTQKGNNNAYCQDNEISWLNWNLLDSHKGLYEFTKNLIAFRKKHSLFHRSTEPTLMDHKSVGLPDVSFHGEKAWCPDFERYSASWGCFTVLLMGKCRRQRGTLFLYCLQHALGATCICTSQSAVRIYLASGP